MVHFLSLKLYFLYLNFILTLTKVTLFALKVSRSLYCFTSSVSHGVENYFPRLWGTGISVDIFLVCKTVVNRDNFSNYKIWKES